jgi:hypothetical protein
MGDENPAPGEGASPTNPPEPPKTDRLPDDHPLVRAHARVKSELSTATGELTKLRDQEKSEGEKLADKLTAAEQRAVGAEQRALRMEVAQAKGLTASQAKRLVGATQEELEADADELLAAFAAENQDGERPPGRPTERLRSGAVPEAEPEPDIDDIVSKVRRI